LIVQFVPSRSRVMPFGNGLDARDADSGIRPSGDRPDLRLNDVVEAWGKTGACRFKSCNVWQA
jgi:hypothetical protein